MRIPLSHPKLSLLALMLAMPLAACGGDDSPAPVPTPSPTPTPAPANRPPTFTSATTASVAENSTGTVYTATATDPDGNPITFSISGGADAALFQISAVGALSFRTSPDFEAPADADRNNVYQVQIGASDGTASATIDIAITVTNVGPDGFRVARVGTGFASPLFLAAVPDGSGRVFVVEQGGRIRILNPATGAVAATPFFDLGGALSTDGERGLLGFATAPDFTTSGAFYVYLTNPTGDIEIRRYRTTAANRDTADPTTVESLITIPHRDFNNHNGGWIGFGPDGFLYAAVGDGGNGGDPSNNAQNTNVLLGKLLRLDVSQDGFPADPARNYAIPAGNPFASSGGRPEIWAFGLRNPFRNSFDFTSGLLLIADVGQNEIEEIDLMRPSDGGANFGWSILEGTNQYKGPAQPSFVPPVAQYSHGSGPDQGVSVTGGYVYRGPVESLRGQYFFADLTGKIFSLPLSDLQLGQTLPSSRFTIRTTAFAPNAGSINNITSFGLDQSNNLYIVDFDGEIFRIEPN